MPNLVLYYALFQVSHHTQTGLAVHPEALCSLGIVIFVQQHVMTHQHTYD